MSLCPGCDRPKCDCVCAAYHAFPAPATHHHLRGDAGDVYPVCHLRWGPADACTGDEQATCSTCQRVWQLLRDCAERHRRAVRAEERGERGLAAAALLNGGLVTLVTSAQPERTETRCTECVEQSDEPCSSCGRPPRIEREAATAWRKRAAFDGAIVTEAHALSFFVPVAQVLLVVETLRCVSAQLLGALGGLALPLSEDKAWLRSHRDRAGKLHGGAAWCACCGRVETAGPSFYCVECLAVMRAARATGRRLLHTPLHAPGCASFSEMLPPPACDCGAARSKL